MPSTSIRRSGSWRQAPDRARSAMPAPTTSAAAPSTAASAPASSSRRKRNSGRGQSPALFFDLEPMVGACMPSPSPATQADALLAGGRPLEAYRLLAGGTADGDPDAL